MPRAIHSGSADAREAASAEFLCLAAWTSRRPWGCWGALFVAGSRACRRVHRSGNRIGTFLIGHPPKGRPSTLARQGTFFGRQRSHSLPSSEPVRKMAITWPMELRANVRVLFELPGRSLSQDSFYGAWALVQGSTFRYPQRG